MKNKLNLLFLVFILLASACAYEETVSDKTFPDITLINKIEFTDPDDNRDKFGCAFLLKHQDDTFAITAKHIISIAKSDEMKKMNLDGFVTKWSMRPLNKETENVVVGKLLNEDKNEKIEGKHILKKDWLVFNIQENNSKIKPLEFRKRKLTPGEKLYVVGWTRHVEEGPQRVFEFEYLRHKGNNIMLKSIKIPNKFGGLSGGPLVDAEGYVLGIGSRIIEDEETGDECFAPFAIDQVVDFLDSLKSK